MLAPRGGGPDNGTNFGTLSTLTLNLSQPRRILGRLLKAYIRSLDSSDLTKIEKNYPVPSLVFFFWLATPGREFRHFTVILDVKRTPWKKSLFEINFLCETTLGSALIPPKNQLLISKIKEVMTF